MSNEKDLEGEAKTTEEVEEKVEETMTGEMPTPEAPEPEEDPVEEFEKELEEEKIEDDPSEEIKETIENIPEKEEESEEVQVAETIEPREEFEDEVSEEPEEKEESEPEIPEPEEVEAPEEETIEANEDPVEEVEEKAEEPAEEETGEAEEKVTEAPEKEAPSLVPADEPEEIPTPEDIEKESEPEEEKETAPPSITPSLDDAEETSGGMTIGSALLGQTKKAEAPAMKGASEDEVEEEIEEEKPEEVEEKPEVEANIFALRTTANREDQVMDFVASNAKRKKLPVYAVIRPHGMRGYIFMEAAERSSAEEAVHGIPYARGLLPNQVNYSEIEHMLEQVKKEINMQKNDIVEIISGAFKREKAKVTRIDKAKEEVVVELMEAAVPIPITLKVDAVKVIRRPGEDEGN